MAHKKADQSRAPKIVQVSAKLSTDIYTKLKAKADADDRTVAYTVRRLILDGLGLDHRAAR